MTAILVINSGSSSFKYQLIEMETETRMASGLVERIGEASGRCRHEVGGETFNREVPIADHTAGFAVMLEAFAEHGSSLAEHPPVAIGHRVVHGGMRFFEPTIITPLVLINIEDLSELAPLHNPPNVEAIVAAQLSFPDVPHVAVFDTAFHQSMPPAAYTYALDQKVAEQHRVRRYGFHGTSHKYVSEAAAAFLGRPITELKQIVLHLGNGASACAVDGGRSVETSMGMTPLEGLVMGTRSGDIDPGILFHLNHKMGMDSAGFDVLLNRRSGMLGLTGMRDMRDVTDAAASGDQNARLGLDVYLHRLKQYIGGYYAQLGHLDVIAFTAGVGENSAIVRAGALVGLEELGIEIDADRNEAPVHDTRRISTDASRVAVLVVPTDEELEIARQTLVAVAKPVS